MEESKMGSFNFEKLPPDVIEKLFDFVRYADIVQLRLVNRWFNGVSSKLLNKAFLNVKMDLEREMNHVVADLKANEDDQVCRTANMYLRYKILQILKSEISVLYAVCERYVTNSVYCFAGGKILDYFYEIMSRHFELNDAKNPLESHSTMQLFLLAEEFMDYFEEKIEPNILEGSPCPWYGTKIVDILDLYVNSNYHVTASYQQEFCQVSGRYEILNPECTTELKLVEGVPCPENVQKFTRYARNQMRWHNFFSYVDASYESMNIMKKRERKYNKFCLNSDETNDDIENVHNNDEITIDKFNKTFSRRIGNPCSSENVSYAVELQCSKNCVPMRLSPYVASMSQEDDTSLSDFRFGAVNDSDEFSNFTQEASRNYDFLLTLKVVLPSDVKATTAIENYVELYHSCRNCEINEKTKEIPL